MMIKKRAIIIFIVISGILLIIPILFFVVNFWGTKISEKPEDWAYFGGYIGGLAGTIVTLLSLFILGYISVWVSRQGNEENKNLYFMKKKMDAYDELAYRLHLFIKGENKSDLLRALKAFNRNTLLVKVIEKTRMVDYKDDDVLCTESKRIYYNTLEFYYFILHFQLRYGHIFEYDFKSLKYKELISSLENYRDKLQVLYERINFSEHIDEFKDFNFLNEFNFLKDSLLSFVSRLKNEVS